MALPVQEPGLNNEIKSLKVSVILLLGGNGTRMGTSVPKQYLLLAGDPIAVHSIRKFVNHPYIRELVIVCGVEYQAMLSEAISRYRPSPRHLVTFERPGRERWESTINGFKALQATDGLVAIHDGARPLFSLLDFNRTCEDANVFGASVLAVKMKPSVKQSDGTGFIDQRAKLPSREFLWEAQTPQVIRYDLLQRGIQKLLSGSDRPTDDVEMVQHLTRVKITEASDYRNIKITTPEDLIVATSLLRT